MTTFKNDLLGNICFTELVHERINTKLKIDLSKKEIEKLVDEIIAKTDDGEYRKKAKTSTYQIVKKTSG